MYCSLPEVSSSMARVMGSVTSLEKKAICWGWLSSSTLKSSCFRSVTMCLLLSRTVTNRFTRFTWVRMTGGCCAGSCARAAATHPKTAAAAEQTARTFFPERMYTFLVEVTRPKYRKLGCLRPVKMRRSARRDVRLGPPELKPKKVWPEDHEKSTKNRAAAAGALAPGRWVVRGGAERRGSGSVGRHTECSGADCAAVDVRRAAERSAEQDHREFQPGGAAGYGKGPLREPGAGPAARRIPCIGRQRRTENRRLHRRSVSALDDHSSRQ